MQDRYRLPRSVIPSRYDLTIEPDLEAATFSGTEAVTVEVHERIDEIVINALDLAIDNGWLSNAAGTRIEVSGIAFDQEPNASSFAPTASLAQTQPHPPSSQASSLGPMPQLPVDVGWSSGQARGGRRMG